MLAALSALMIAVILGLLISNRASPVATFILVPFIFALIAGFGLSTTGKFMTTGLQHVVSITTLFVFAILYFRTMADAGMFDPIVNRILHFAGEDPATIVLATAALAAIVQFDGSGATSVLITIPAMLPIYKRLGISKLVLTTAYGLAAGTMNMVPWGGPTTRAGATLNMSPTDLWVPMIPVQIIGLLAALAIAYYLGLRERKRLAQESTSGRTDNGVYNGDVSCASPTEISPGHSRAERDIAHNTTFSKLENDEPDSHDELLRPNLFWLNLGLTLIVLVALVTAILPSEFIFMIGLVAALLINYPNPGQQMALIQRNSRAPILMASILLSTGVFLGIGSESGMFEALATAIANVLPAGAASFFPLSIGILAVPMSIPIEVNSYYLGMLPILADVVDQAGVDPVAIAKASMVGMDTVGWPLTPLTGAFFLLVGLAEVNISAHIRHMFPWAWLVGIVMLIAALVTGQVPLPIL